MIQISSLNPNNICSFNFQNCDNWLRNMHVRNRAMLPNKITVLFVHQVWCGINVWLDANQIFVSTVLGLIFLCQCDSFQCINTLPEYRLRGEVWNCICQHEKVLDWKQSNVQGKCLCIGMKISFRMNTNTSCNKGLLIFLKNFRKKGHYILSYTPPPSLTYVLLNTV